MKFIFVGERPSAKALAMNIHWKDGRLAAKQLFDALVACGIDPADQQFDNVFKVGLGAETVCPRAIHRIRSASRQMTVVAMGQKASHVLTTYHVAHLRIVHPAARGHIRKKECYATHVREVLLAAAID